jgi:hypothetical protein
MGVYGVERVKEIINYYKCGAEGRENLKVHHP